MSTQSSKAWHPKLTPYRLAVLAITAGLGSAKVVVTQRGGSIVSTTLEWVAGTLLSVIFFFLSAYESQDVVPSWLSWLFEPDCMVAVWNLLARISIQRPDYVSDETPPDSWIALGSSNPDITPYRILVCSTVTAFGLSNAMLGYVNQSTAATWTDWAIAVPMTTLLYILGLYEYNSSNIFFTRDQTEILCSVMVGILYSIGIVIASAWTACSAYYLHMVVSETQWDLEFIPKVGSQHTLETYLLNFLGAGFMLFVLEGFIFTTVIGIFSLRALLKPAVKIIMVVLRKSFRGTRRPIFIALHSISPTMTINLFEWLDRAHTHREIVIPYLRIASHLAWNLSPMIVQLTYFAIVLGGIFVLTFKSEYLEDTASVFIMVIMWAVNVLAPLGLVYSEWKSMIASIPPLDQSRYRNGRQMVAVSIA